MIVIVQLVGRDDGAIDLENLLCLICRVKETCKLCKVIRLDVPPNGLRSQKSCLGLFDVRVNNAIRTLYLPPRKLLPVLRKKGQVPSVDVCKGVRLNNRFWSNCVNAGNAAAPRLQRPPHSRLRPYIPALVSFDSTNKQRAWERPARNPRRVCTSYRRC